MNLNLEEIKLIDTIRNLQRFEKIEIKLSDEDESQIVYTITKKVRDTMKR